MRTNVHQFLVFALISHKYINDKVEIAHSCLLRLILLHIIASSPNGYIIKLQNLFILTNENLPTQQNCFQVRSKDTKNSIPTDLKL